MGGWGLRPQPGVPPLHPFQNLCFAVLELASIFGWTDFAAKKSAASGQGKKRNCDPSKSLSCGSSCVRLKKKDGTPTQCRGDIKKNPDAKQSSDWLAKNAEASATKTPKAKGAKSKTATQSEYKPFMSKSEADAYTKDSKWKDRVFFHGSDDASIKNITTTGVDTNATKVGMFGRGFYLTPNKTSDDAEKNGNEGLGADFYAGMRDGTPSFVEAKVKTSNPREFADFGEFTNFIRSNGVDYDKSFGEDYTNKVTDLMQRLGHDAIEIKDSGEIVVYNKESVAAYNRGGY